MLEEVHVSSHLGMSYFELRYLLRVFLLTISVSRVLLLALNLKVFKVTGWFSVWVPNLHFKLRNRGTAKHKLNRFTRRDLRFLVTHFGI